MALAVEVLGAFGQQYSDAWSAGMRAKLGLPDGLDEAVASTLIRDLLTQLQQSHVDYTSFFRNLGAAARGDAERAVSSSIWRRSTGGWSAGARSVRMRRRWTG